MAGKYYYLVASLPYLKTEELLITKKAFLEECSKWLSLQDIRALKEADMESMEEASFDVPALIEWKEFDSILRRYLFNFRKEDGLNNPMENPADEGLKAIFEQGTPLLMEKKLAQVKLDFIEEQSRKYYFDLNWLIMYYLKLQVLERSAVFDKDIGEKFFYELCEVKYE